ncbi:Predicted Zn-dependent peptidase [Lishizhenia tianjinensis]|uniref:Predicted Zn-dependent peptidase n=1 Tax=Lishizhenia tianjinensis TaxID=477690 RepID=A0A1I6XCW9_9FLAO|nr:pitrilysin family protein [Lishizhenia tianjinensis]SFT35971.1 Predicted Zn-dependent peptidase [Lishizhenia tianjinensis]
MIQDEPTIFTLSNGMRVVYLHTDKQVAHLGVTVLGGSRFEDDHEVGLAHFLEHCIFKGTQKRKTYHILSRLDSVGGELNAYTAKEEICIYGSFSFEHLKRTSELLSDITFHSVFPEKEIEKEKEVVLDELNAYMDSPSDKIFDDFENYLFGEHPLGNNILGTEESVRSFHKDDLLRYTEKFFYPDNMVISYVGQSSVKQLEKVLEKDFGHITSKKEKQHPKGFDDYKPFRKVLKEANYQSHILLGGLAPGYNDDERRVMSLLVNMLGGPALNSRLNLSVREKYGYTYNIEANYTPYQEIGFWSIYAGTDPKYMKKTEKLILKELKRFTEVLLTEGQLKKGKEQFKGHLALSMDSNSGMMLGLGKSLLIFDQIDTLDDIYDELDRITAEEIRALAQKFFAADQISTLIFEQNGKD